MSLRRRAFILLILIGFLIVPFRVNAVELKKTFEKKISKNDMSGTYALFPSYDDKGKINGYTVVGNGGACDPGHDAFVTKFNLDNKKVFGYLFDEHDIPFSAYNKWNFTFTLKDNNSNVLWEKSYGTSDKGYKNILQYYADYDENGDVTGYVVLLYTDSTNIDGVNPGHIIIKYDKNGNLLWQKNYKFIYDSLLYFKKYYSHDYYFDSNGNYFSIDYNNKKVQYYSSAGELIWTKDGGQDVNPNYTNGNIDGVVVDCMDYFIKYDLDGNETIKVQKTVSDGEYNIYRSHVLTSRNDTGDYDGYISFVSFSTYNYKIKSYLTKYDYQGNIVWSETIDNFEVFGFMESYDENGEFNGYTLAGNTTDSDGVRHEGSIIKYTYPKYNIVSDNDKGGVINVSDKAFAGDTVKVEVKAKEGYVVKRIVVKDEAGKEIEVSNDGTFVMPEGKVTVSAIYERITNPDTVSACYMILGIILVISIGTLIIIKQKEEGK